MPEPESGPGPGRGSRPGSGPGPGSGCYPGSETFGDFVAAALPGLLRFGHVLTGSPHEAEDLVQEALGRTMRRWSRSRPDDPVAYVRRIMVNTHLTRWRRWGSRVRLGDVPEVAADDTGLQRSHDRDLLRRALASLPPRQRAVLVLRYLEDLPDSEIAALLGCQQVTVRSQAARGLAALRPLLAETGLAETSLAETGPAQTGAAQTGAAQTGPARSGLARSGLARSGFARSGLGLTRCGGEIRGW